MFTFEDECILCGDWTEVWYGIFGVIKIKFNIHLIIWLRSLVLELLLGFNF